MFLALATMITSLGLTSPAQSSVTTAQDQALSFIEEVLPIDRSQYNLTFNGYFVSDLPGIAISEPKDYAPERVIYTLTSDESELRASFTIENNILTTCQVSIQKGSFISDRSYTNLNDVAKSFLEKYQAYTGTSMVNMINLLSNVDVAKDQTIVKDNLKLNITNGEFPNEHKTTSLMWWRSINGCEYLELSVSFRDGAFAGFKDTREAFPVGDTTVNVSKDQAIAIAMKYIEAYSYAMPDGSKVSGFNVTEDRTTAYLVPSVRESNILYPAWKVILYLNQTYPGSVYGLLVSIWADSGEVFGCNNQAAGGSSDLISESNSSPASPTISPSPSSIENKAPASMENNKVPIDLGTVAVIAVVVTAIAVATITLIVKKRSK